MGGIWHRSEYGRGHIDGEVRCATLDCEQLEESENSMIWTVRNILVVLC